MEKDVSTLPHGYHPRMTIVADNPKYTNTPNGSKEMLCMERRKLGRCIIRLNCILIMHSEQLHTVQAQNNF